MQSKGGKTVNVLIGAAAVLLLLLPIMWQRGAFDERPYRSVKVLSVVEGDGYIDFVSSFIKQSCTFDRFVVVGIDLGVTTPLEYVDVVPPSNIDRTKGRQTLSIRINTDGYEYDEIEFRTRHICGGSVVYDQDGNRTIVDGYTVDGIFARVSL